MAYFLSKNSFRADKCNIGEMFYFWTTSGIKSGKLLKIKKTPTEVKFEDGASSVILYSVEVDNFPKPFSVLNIFQNKRKCKLGRQEHADMINSRQI